MSDFDKADDRVTLLVPDPEQNLLANLPRVSPEEAKAKFAWLDEPLIPCSREESTARLHEAIRLWREGKL